VALAVVMDVDIVLMNLDILKEEWFWQKDYLNLIIIILKMETNKIHERVLEIQKQIPNIPPEKQTEMLSELFELASKLEQSLAELKIENSEE
jgi:hypothetical protein